MDSTITLKEYLNKNKTFVIPGYQRGYIWGKQRGNSNSVSYILNNSIIPGFKNKKELFLQGVTVSEKDAEIIVIDGQQRTTFFYLLLKFLEYQGKFTLRYDIRETSNNFLAQKNILSDIEDNPEEKFQDIYFFKKTLRIISKELSNLKEKKDFLNYILDNIKFLYINIPDPDQAVKVFSMMNGNRAVMLPEEIIKAEMLRVASIPTANIRDKPLEDQISLKWDCDMLRSRYAREWDKWLQWWNRNDVRYWFGCKNVMGHLISTYLKSKSKESDVKKEQTISFELFRETCLQNSNPIEAKKTFDGLRRLQKKFEDSFHDPVSYNRIGAILRVHGHENAEKFIKWHYLEEKRSANDLERYYKLAFLNLSHRNIVEKDTDKFAREFEMAFSSRKKEIFDDYLFENNKAAAFNLLLRLNIDEDIKLKRKFDFNVWEHHSLEHIYPKSKVFHSRADENLNQRWFLGDGNECTDNIENIKNNPRYICRDTCECDNGAIKTTEHSIGNLVLLYVNNNSSVGAQLFEDKKEFFFNPQKKEFFESRHLLHTLYKFARSSWKGKNIAENKKLELNALNEYYKDFCGE